LSERSALTELIRRGYRRSVTHIFCHQLSLAAVVALGGFILLLLLGTQILDWYWPIILFVAALAVGLWRIRRKIPTKYQVARSIDSRLEWKDVLSTACYFGEHPERTTSPREVVERQRAAAEELAPSADLRVGLPFLAPRSLYACGALAMAAFGLFAVRYGVTHSLSLRPSLVQMAFDGLFGSPQQVAEAKKLGKPASKQSPQETIGVEALDDTKATTAQPPPDDATEATNTQNPTDADSGSDPVGDKDKSGAKADDQASDDKSGADADEDADEAKSASDSLNDDKSGKDNAGGDQQANSKNSDSSKSQNGNSSLADKMRDAISNLISKLKPQSKNNDGKQASNSQSQSQSGEKQNGKQNNQSSKQQDDMNAGDPKSEVASNGDQSQPSPGKGSGKNPDHANAPDGKSGIGKDDGDKATREAEQLAAMGKISELIGKRAQNVSGEVMVEVSSGKQQLRTQYSQRDATHVEAGSDINRDEVPLAYQQYVQQYFEEIRKSSPAKTKTSPDTKPKTPGT